MKETDILPLIAEQASTLASESISGLQTTTRPCSSTWWCCVVPSSRSSPYHGRCLRRNYPRNDGFKSGKSLSTDTSESPAPGSRLQESGGKDDDLSWWSWLKKGRRKGREEQETLEGDKRATRNLLGLGRGVVFAAFDLSFGCFRVRTALLRGTSTEHPQTDDRIYFHPPHLARPLQNTTTSSTTTTNTSTNTHPSIPISAHLQSTRKSLRLPHTYISLARSLSTSRSCQIKSTHTSPPPRPMAQKDDNSPSSLWTRRSK